MFDFGEVYNEARSIGFQLGKLLDECGAVRREVEKYLNQNLGRSDQAVGFKAGISDYYSQVHILDREMRKNKPLAPGWDS